jgi:hypothetical protein
MEGENHCELGQCIKFVSNTYLEFIYMINRTKYLVQFEMKNKFCYIVYTINIPYDSLNSNEKIIQIMWDNTPKNIS